MCKLVYDFSVSFMCECVGVGVRACVFLCAQFSMNRTELSQLGAAGAQCETAGVWVPHPE